MTSIDKHGLKVHPTVSKPKPGSVHAESTWLHNSRLLPHHAQILTNSQNLTATMSRAAARAAADTCSVQGKFSHELCRRLLIMANHGQQQEDSPNDAVDEHGQQQQEGEEGRCPLEVDDDNQDEHQRNEDHH